MTVNPQRGEVSAELDGRQWTLCLTLDALARLENHFGANDLSALAERLSTGSFSAADLTAILHAGLVGGGHDISCEEVAQMRIACGAAGYAQVAGNLLAAAFGSPGPHSIGTDETA